VKWAQILGAKRVIGIDNVQWRLDFAAEKSGIETINFDEHKDVVKRLQELVPGGIDVGLHCGESSNDRSVLVPLSQPSLSHFPRAKEHDAQDRESTQARDGHSGNHQ
jgi:hypothetical protein